MSPRSRSSFRWKLLRSFLAVGVIPLAVCFLLTVNFFRFSLERSARDSANAQLASMTSDLSELLGSCEQVLLGLRAQSLVSSGLEDGWETDTRVYNALYTAAAPLLRQADFSLYDADGRLLYTTGDFSRETRSPRWGLLYAASQSGDVVFQGGGSQGHRLELACTVSAQDRLAGYAVAGLTAAHLDRLFALYSSGGGVALLDPFWSQVYASPSLQDDALVPQLRAQLLAGRPLSGQENFTYHVSAEPGSGFFILFCQPIPLAGWVMHLFYLIAGLTILLCMILCLAVSMGFSRQLFRPIRALNNAMAAVEEGDLDARLPVSGTDELSQLSGRFNRMAQRLKTNLADSLRQQQELGDVQVRMMQAQLNPHFLYNTLDTLKWLGKINQVPQVATISADLADILRQSITGEEFVPLREELALLDRYVEIQNIRFPGKFQYSAQADQDLLDVLVPKLMLQPLVENSIIHGFEDGSSGHITVLAGRSGGELLLTVLDDGCGMSPESLERFSRRDSPASGGHLGLYNVDAILRLHYGPDKGLKFRPAPGGRGTCIRIELPITYRKGEDPPC